MMKRRGEKRPIVYWGFPHSPLHYSAVREIPRHKVLIMHHTQSNYHKWGDISNNVFSLCRRKFIHLIKLDL